MRLSNLRLIWSLGEDILKIASSRLDFSIYYVSQNRDLYHTIVFYPSMEHAHLFNVVIPCYYGNDRVFVVVVIFQNTAPDFLCLVFAINPYPCVICWEKIEFWYRKKSGKYFLWNNFPERIIKKHHWGLWSPVRHMNIIDTIFVLDPDTHSSTKKPNHGKTQKNLKKPKIPPIIRRDLIGGQ